MPLIKMEHYLVLTGDIIMTRDFYQEVLQLHEGYRPDLGFPGYWLYLNDTPVIHIAEWLTYTAHSNALSIPVSKPAESTAAFEHIAFNCTNSMEMIDRLDADKIPYHRNDVPEVGLVQLFISDPNGIKIELNYMDD